MKAVVYKIHSDFYYVKPLGKTGGLVTCKLREVLKKGKIKIKVGDFVEIEESGAICGLLPRKNTLLRPNVSNLDFVVVVSSLLEPALDFKQLNRYLTFLKYNKIGALLCFNKDDLLNENELKTKIENIYGNLGYKILFTSALSNDGLEEFKKIIKGKTVAFCGLSGVGKSSILNALSETGLKVGEISRKNKHGCHTTRHCEIIEYEGAKIIDTPGFSKLVFDFILPKDLTPLFPDIEKYAGHCKYSDCLHTISDEECNVIKNLNKIEKTRYESYLDFLIEAKEYKQKLQNESKKEENGIKMHFDRNFTKISSKRRGFSRKKINQNLGEEDV